MTTVIKQWFLGKLLDSLNDKSIPDDFKEYVRAQDLEDDKIAKIIDAGPRMLFDVFDEHKVYIEIGIDYKKIDVTYTYNIINNDNTFSDGINYNFRIEAEKAAIEQAFQMLNDKL